MKPKSFPSGEERHNLQFLRCPACDKNSAGVLKRLAPEKALQGVLGDSGTTQTGNFPTTPDAFDFPVTMGSLHPLLGSQETFVAKLTRAALPTVAINCWAGTRSVNKLHINRMWNNPAFVSFDEQTLNCFASALAVIEREFIYPHRDETIR